MPATSSNELFRNQILQLFTTGVQSIHNNIDTDTTFHPNIQAGWLGINIEENAITSSIKSLADGDSLYFCSGYFNPPQSICREISQCPASLTLLGADARSNGFYKTKFPKSGITPAYQLFAQHMEVQLANREYMLEEWYREKVIIYVLVETEL